MMAASGKKERIHNITRHDIIEFMNESDYGLLNSLNKTGFGFDKFLKRKGYFITDSEIDYELVELIVEACSRVCSIRRQNNYGSIQKFLKTLAECENFIFQDAFNVINDCLERRRKIFLASYVRHYLLILKTMMKFQVACNKIADYTFPAMQNILNLMQARKIQNLNDCQDEYEKLKREVDKFEKPSPVSDEDDDEAGLFRQLSIVPKDNDIVNVIVPDLPCNKIDGPYNSVEHYLSVHFRLMREDMLRSFRDCIRMCENPSEASRSGCRIYESVMIDFPPSYTPDGICYRIEIRTHNAIDLSKGNALMVGNMVCLTPDNFNTIYCAILSRSAKASCNKTKECRTEIRVEDTFINVLKPDVEYLMIEPNAYFECYKHVLGAIREFDKSTFPLSDFLVFLEYDNPEPEYLACPDILKGKKYCLPVKCKASSRKTSSGSKITDENLNNEETPKAETILQNTQEFGDMTNKKNVTDEAVELNSAKLEQKGELVEEDSHDIKTFDPLCYEDWPTAADLELDDQQLYAFKTALTKKVAVIQGPPGTGKTFIGVKVVQALLENVPLTPIVICCLTNHALDQFLEHILKFTKKVIRLGHQSESKILPPHVLENLVTACKQSSDANSYLLMKGDLKKSLDLMHILAPELLDKDSKGEYDEKFAEKRNLCNELNELLCTERLCKEKYLEDDVINKIIKNRKLKDQLREGSSTHSKALSTSVLEWLCCSRTSELYEVCNSRFLKIKRKEFDKPLEKPNMKLWSLKLSERFECFYYWRQNYLLNLQKEIDTAQNIYQKLMLEHCGKELDPLKIDILKSAFIIGVTTTGAAKYRELIRSTGAAILIVEEAAEVLESHIIASLMPTTQHLILIGDHKQLRPLPANHELSEMYNLKISMFERLFINNAPSATLISQHRMKPCIADLLVQEELYPDLKSYDNVYKYEDIVGVKSSVFFLNHCYAESDSSTSTSSSNLFEAQTIAKLAKYFCMQSYLEENITILATYSAQVPLIQTYLEEEELNIKVATVDNFQGEENDLLLISFVRSNKIGKIGFLMENNRVNVALSRARKGMFCLGNFSLYAEKSRLWKCIVDKLQAQNMIGEKLPLQCSRHLKTTFVETSEEILDFMRRGCSEKCGFKLPCGHTCVRKCHNDDADHVLYQCALPCEKYIDENKKCTRMCYKRCKNIKRLNVNLPCGHGAKQKKDGSIITQCQEEEQKLLPCKHFDTLRCGTDVSTYKCRASVSVNLPCGHKKSVFCHKKNDLDNVICYSMKPVVGPCGHEIDVPCSVKFEEHELFPFCKQSCGILLKCGHPCTGTCFSCSDNGIHAMCSEKCDTILNCGHKCRGYCGSPCPPCTEKCSLSCSHKMVCINSCNRPCIPCKEKCDRGCSHVGRCVKLCHEECSVEECTYVCSETLTCGHRCIGLCGDPCPYLCRKCNKEDIQTGNPESDFYIQLEDCDHVVEISQLDEHIYSCIDCCVWPDCPICNTPIRQSYRYKNRLQRAKEDFLNRCNNSDEIDDVQYLLNALCPPDGVIPSEFFFVHKKIKDILDNEIKPSSACLYILKQCIMSLRILIIVNERLKETEISNKTFLQNRMETLLIWICNHLKCASYQQLSELENQVFKLEKELNKSILM
ncbi:NFX1-type zinc finger-containing protein 1 [Araneus ventricosus]|uniref:NFX1-type zinc finger-containing protein 1 n=1 Tax=Araneus ventricosus TaxID=182803 RepID=A0A4Y2RMV8_ARAVE|nr:NFX1-type zinc finger-containing protein 1 [Araneus ventricosus]